MSGIGIPVEDRAFAFRAEMRAVEEGHRAILVDHSTDRVGYHGLFRVVSETWPDERWLVNVWVDHAPGTLVRTTCTCVSGQTRYQLPVPCKHGALVARRMEREGRAVWRDGLWWTPGTKDPSRGSPIPDDPFEGLVAEDDERPF